MSTSTLDTVLYRVKGATPERPLAVFKHSSPGKFNAVIASSTVTQLKIKNKDPALIGLFDNSMDSFEVSRKLHNAAA